MYGSLDELLSASRNGDDTKMQQLLLNCDYKQAIARSAFLDIMNVYVYLLAKRPIEMRILYLLQHRMGLPIVCVYYWTMDFQSVKWQ